MALLCHEELVKLNLHSRNRCRLCIRWSIPRFFDWVVPHLVGVVAGLTKLAEAQSWWSDESTKWQFQWIHVSMSKDETWDINWMPDGKSSQQWIFFWEGEGGHAHAKCGGQDVHTSGLSWFSTCQDHPYLKPTGTDAWQQNYCRIPPTKTSFCYVSFKDQTSANIQFWTWNHLWSHTFVFIACHGCIQSLVLCIDFHKNTRPCEKWNLARRSSCQSGFRAKEFTPHPLLYWVRRSREFALPAAEITEPDSLLLLTNSSGVSSNLYQSWMIPLIIKTHVFACSFK